jgi:hypothetical protein
VAREFLGISSGKLFSKDSVGEEEPFERVKLEGPEFLLQKIVGPLIQKVALSQENGFLQDNKSPKPKQPRSAKAENPAEIGVSSVSSRETKQIAE